MQLQSCRGEGELAGTAAEQLRFARLMASQADCDSRLRPDARSVKAWLGEHYPPELQQASSSPSSASPGPERHRSGAGSTVAQGLPQGLPSPESTLPKLAPSVLTEDKQPNATVLSAYAEVSSTPSQYYVAVTLARALYGITLIVYWAVGWLLSDVAWPFIIPPVVGALAVWAEIAQVHRRGPMQHDASAIGRVALAFTVTVFTYVTLLPIFMPVRRKPFAARFLQTLGSAFLAFAGCVFVQTPVIFFARKLGVATLDHSFWSLMLQAAIRTFTFIDCWTDCEVTVILWSKVRPAQLRGAEWLQAHHRSAAHARGA